MTLVTFDKVSKRFDEGALALDRVSLSMPARQFCVILGPSGSGKSTLLRTVNGMVKPTGGSVTVNGNIINSSTLKKIRPRIGMVHQQFELVPRLSVINNVLSGALPAVATLRSLFGFFPSCLKRKACRLLEQVELGEEHLYRRASQLSGGQQQRVAIARAFILDPVVVLADEPVASLDPATSRSILQLLRDTAEVTGATVLCSLHQVELAREFADRIVGIHQGQICFDGPPDDLNHDQLVKIYGEAVSDDVRQSPPLKKMPDVIIAAKSTDSSKTMAEVL